MKLTIEMSLDNAAFQTENEEGESLDRDFTEVERCLERVLNKLRSGHNIDAFMDSNGNTVGSFEIDEES
jgi:hypothetical protein